MSCNVAQRGRAGALTAILILCESGASWLLLVRIGQVYFLYSIAERHVVEGEHIMMDILLSCSIWKIGALGT